MAKRFLILVLMAVTYAQPAHAVWFDSLVNDIPSDKEFVSRPIYNDTDRTNLYTVSAFKIDKPGKDGEHRVNANELELLWAPLKFSISSHGTEYFKLYYRGPKDDVERYYRVIFKESPVRMFPKNDTGHHLQVLPVTSMSTFLIVRPRNMRLKYSVDENQGVIENSGNTFFRVIIQKGCDGDDEHSRQFYMLPGEKFKDGSVNAKNRKFIVANKKYIPLGNACFKP
ncbi:molecular chaperone [Kluyvera sichuanensis]|uniref:molecular chaperone n=1 Tax=Kluyvera sichuanensis TaxID=2725494 RepID=UPI0039F6FF4D